MSKLTPPDRDRCQAERLEGSFMTLGPRPLARCENAPIVVATENKPNPKDGLRGSMSLCGTCVDALEAKFGKKYCTFAPIAPRKRAAAKSSPST